MAGMTNTEKTAGAVIIGDEILSGRTKDTNLNTIALYCEGVGLALKEARTVGDTEPAIIEAVNALRSRYDYVFTTGGIGPTHDDITAESIAKAFGVPLIYHPEALAQLKQQLGERFNESRARMARTPEGAVLIDNPVSVGPGFMTGNVITMAGIPRVMAAMLESARPFITGGPKVLTEVIQTSVPEGEIAAPLGEIQKRFPTVSIGSYPGMRDGGIANRIVLRSTDAALLAEAKIAVQAIAG